MSSRKKLCGNGPSANRDQALELAAQDIEELRDGWGDVGPSALNVELTKAAEIVRGYKYDRKGERRKSYATRF